MTRYEMVQQALFALGATTAREVSEFVRRRHGVRIAPMFIPLIVARLLDRAERSWFCTHVAPSAFALETHG